MRIAEPTAATLLVLTWGRPLRWAGTDASVAAACADPGLRSAPRAFPLSSCATVDSGPCGPWRRELSKTTAMSNGLWREELSISQTDGRTLAVAKCGAQAGQAVIYLHGTPGSRLNRYAFDDVLVELGVRLITYDRPGYGNSTRYRGRCVADSAEDVRSIIEHFGLAGIPVFGHSGGGPHALACAALLDGVVSSAASVSGLAPYDSDDVSWAAGFPESTMAEFQVARLGATELEEYLVETYQISGGELLDQITPELPEVDSRFLSDA